MDRIIKITDETIKTRGVKMWRKIGIALIVFLILGANKLVKAESTRAEEKSSFIAVGMNRIIVPPPQPVGDPSDSNIPPKPKPQPVDINPNIIHHRCLACEPGQFPPKPKPQPVPWDFNPNIPPHHRCLACEKAMLENKTEFRQTAEANGIKVISTLERNKDNRSNYIQMAN